MTKLQKLLFKITMASWLLGAPLISWGQNALIEESLDIADSLFEAKKYTESFQIYHEILETGQMTSNAMLLKMAYIKEALLEVPEALYYLNLYYLETSDKTALEKMKLLADTKGLEGYDYSTLDILASYYFKNYHWITLTVLGLSMLTFGYLAYAKIKLKQKHASLAVFFVLITGFLFYLINYGHIGNRGIISHYNTYIMSAPSSGSDVVDIVEAGHKVKILSQKDVWLEIEWDNRIAYTKQKNIRPIMSQ